MESLKLKLEDPDAQVNQKTDGLSKELARLTTQDEASQEERLKLSEQEKAEHHHHKQMEAEVASLKSKIWQLEAEQEAKVRSAPRQET